MAHRGKLRQGWRMVGQLPVAGARAGEHPGRAGLRCWNRPASIEHQAFRTQNVLNGPYGGDMTNTDYPWEPPMAGTEAAHLTGGLDRLRTSFWFKPGVSAPAGLQ